MSYCDTYLTDAIYLTCIFLCWETCTCVCHNLCYFFFAQSDDGTTGLCKIPLLLRILAFWNLWSPSPRWDWVRGSISKFRTVCVANISLAIAHQDPEGVQSAPAFAGCTHHWLPHHRWHTKVQETFWSYQITQISAKHVMIIYYGLFSFHSYFCVHS